MELQQTPTKSTVRFRRWAKRRKNGLAVLLIEIDETNTTEFLIKARVLDECDRDDRKKVGAALSRLIEKLVKEQL